MFIMHGILIVMIHSHFLPDDGGVSGTEADSKSHVIKSLWKLPVVSVSINKLRPKTEILGSAKSSMSW
jgi:hypothetical protein